MLKFGTHHKLSLIYVKLCGNPAMSPTGTVVFNSKPFQAVAFPLLSESFFSSPAPTADTPLGCMIESKFS